MAKAPRIGTVLIVPLVLLSVSLLENVLSYKLRQHIHNDHLRTALSLMLYGSAFALASEWLGPQIRRMFVSARATSRQSAGTGGVWLFFTLAYAAIYWAYLVMERRGPGALLPPAWR